MEARGWLSGVDVYLLQLLRGKFLLFICRLPLPLPLPMPSSPLALVVFMYLSLLIIYHFPHLPLLHHVYLLSSSLPINFHTIAAASSGRGLFSLVLKQIRRILSNAPAAQTSNEQETVDFDCLGTGQDVEGVVSPSSSTSNFEETVALPDDNSVALGVVWEWAVLVSPFFFWGTTMVAMKEVIPKYGPFFVSSFCLIPVGFLLIAFAASRNRPSPSGLTAWLSISLFALVDATCFQGFLAEGLQKTSAGLGSVIIDSQPLIVAILTALLFGESIGFVGATGLVLGVIGLLLLEHPKELSFLWT